MAKHLSTRDVTAIVDLIHGWTGTKITWDAICDASEGVVNKRPTRQSLSAHESIVDAYKQAKRNIKYKKGNVKRPGSLKCAADRIAKLEMERDALKEENRAYKQLFITWQYNAYKNGLSESLLNQSLPSIDRGRTDGGIR